MITMPMPQLVIPFSAQNKQGFHCGGSLINSRYVISASHCVNGKDLPTTWSLTHVRLGEWDTTQQDDCDERYTNERICSPPPIDVQIEQKIPHPQYDPYANNQHNDIALLRLSQDVAFNEFVRPICLPIDESLRSNTFVKQVRKPVCFGVE
jgi:hypothetical protein